MNRPTELDFKKLKHDCNHALELVFTEKWLESCRNGRKTILYKDYKTNLTMEKYLLNLPPNLAISMCKFRVSNHNLPIEKGCHSGIKREDRICPLCETELGDEYHYLMSCPYFSSDRSKLIPKSYHNRPNMPKFITLLNTHNTKIQKKIAIFIKLVFQKFKNLNN